MFAVSCIISKFNSNNTNEKNRLKVTGGFFAYNKRNPHLS